MIRDGIDVELFHYTQSVDSEDQATSLTSYLNQHGLGAYKSQPDEVQVPIEARTREEAADKSAKAFMVIETWRMFWKNTDSGVFELQIYDKDR